MAVYDTGFMNNATNVVDLAIGVSSNSGYEFLIGYLILISVFIIFLVKYESYDLRETLIVGSFITAVLSIMLYGAELLPAVAISFPSILLFFAIMYYYFTT